MSATYDYDEDIVSDLHKDAFGIRPRELFWSQWSAASDDGKQAIWDDLIRALQESNARQQTVQQEAIARFERCIAETCAVGAPDRATAIRWLVEAHPDDYGSECSAHYRAEGFCYYNGLPYSMAGELAAAIAQGAAR